MKHKNEWLHFENPHQIISAASIDDVHAALQEIERLINANNWHAAGFISYEAAPAFDSALHVLSADDFPLLWFGLYSEPLTYQTSEVLRDMRSLAELKWQAGITRESYNTAIEKVKEAIAQGKLIKSTTRCV